VGLLTFIENQDSTRLFPALAACAVVVLPSRWESFSLAALDSMAVGRPTVVTSVGGVVEFVEDGRNGLVVPPDDHEALAHAIERLLGDHALRERLVAGAAERVQAFDVAAVARRHAGYFERISRVSGDRERGRSRRAAARSA
jgi:glycosyltransferase involved in cell wall biosynthesis